MKFFEAAGIEGVAAVICLLNWLNAIRSGHLLDFSGVVFALLAVAIYRKWRQLGLI